MCSMRREPRRDDHTIWTAVAPDFVFTVRTYGTGPAYGPPLVRKSAYPKPGTSRSARRDSRETANVSQVRDDGHDGIWSACREVFDDHVPGPVQHPRRQLVNGMGRGPRAALIGPVMPQRPWTLLPRKVLCEFYDAITSVLGRVLLEPTRVLPAKLHDEGPKL